MKYFYGITFILSLSCLFTMNKESDGFIVFLLSLGMWLSGLGFSIEEMKSEK